MPFRFFPKVEGVLFAPNGDAVALRTLVITRGLRYWLLATWAILLGLCVGWRAACSWLIAAIGVGALRSEIEAAIVRRRAISVGRELTAIATLTSMVWAVAPVLAWLEQTPMSRLATMAMLAAGGILVVTQFRHLPKSAVIVGSPYAAVLIWIIASSFGAPVFWPSVAVALVLNSALATNIFFTRVHKAQIEAFQAQQAQLIHELEEARDKANAASMAKSNFLSIISHELRTPMNGVLGAAQLLDTMRMEEGAHELLGVIRESGEDLLALLNDVLDFAKIEQGRLDLDLDPVDLRALLERLVALWSPSAADKALRFRLDIDPGAEPVVLGDKVRIGQVLNNLISNALKFSQDGEIVLSLGSEPDGEGCARTTLAVSDCGPGISIEDRARLFQAFTQLDVSATRRHGGAGLGLAISKRLAHLMGGDLVVGGATSGGARFQLEWHARIATPAEDATATAAADECAPLSVLVVEDHPVNRQILELWLTAQGHAVSLAENGKEAMELGGVQRFDLVLMDVNMPVMDGLTAVRHWRRSVCMDTPIIVLTASASAEDVTQGLSAGASAYLAKPVDFVRLAGVIAEVSEKRLAPKARLRIVS